MKDRIAGWPRRWRRAAELAETRSVAAQAAAVEPAEPLWAVVDSAVFERFGQRAGALAAAAAATARCYWAAVVVTLAETQLEVAVAAAELAV